MKQRGQAGKDPWRRRIGLAGSAVAGVLVMASVAYACILRTGTLMVCSPPSKTFSDGTQCSKAVGSGGQTGLARFSTAGSAISVKARNMADAPYAVFFRVPGSTSSCTSYDGRNSISLLGVDSEGRPLTVEGPRFYVEVNTPPTTATGRAQICVGQEPERVTAQTVNVTVI